MKLKLIAVSFLIAMFCSCTKKYMCACGNPLLDPLGTTIQDTKKNAEKKCKEIEVNFKSTNAPCADCHCKIE